MQQHLIFEFWEEVVELLKKPSLPETRIRQEISKYLRDLEQHGADVAVYHFGAEEAAKAIRNRIGVASKRTRTSRQRKKTA